LIIITNNMAEGKSNAESKTDKFSYWEKNLKTMKDKKAASPPRVGNKPSQSNSNHESSEASDIIKSEDAWSPSSTSESPPPKEKMTEEVQEIEHEDDTEEVVQKQIAVKGTSIDDVEDSTVNEAESIVNNFSENSTSSKEEQESADDIAAEAEDIMSGFSGSKENSSGSEDDDEEQEDGSSVDEPSYAPSGPKEYSLGLGGSSNSDSTEADEVLMHAMSDDDEGDIGLEELFETAAALEVTLETENSVQNERNQQELYENQPITHDDDDDDDEGDVESNSSLSCSTIEEEQENTEELNTIEAPKDKTPYWNAVPRSFKPIVESEEHTTLYSKSRTLLYDSDDEEIGVGSIPMPWFAAVPYSTGKRKKTEDGMSVTSDDIWHGVKGTPIIGANHHLPYTIPNKNPDVTPTRNNRRRNRFILLIIIVILVILGVFLGLWLPVVPNDTNAPTVAPSTDSTASNTTFITVEPTFEPTFAPTIDETPTLVPTTPAPTSSPTKEGPEMDFENLSIIVGQSRGEFLGSVVSMSKDGTFLTALSNSPSDPAKAYSKSGENDWSPLPDIPGSVPSLSLGSTISAAVTEDNKSPVVAVSSLSQVEVYQLTDGTTSGTWIPRGQILEWNAPTGISHTSMSLSSDASTLAMAYVDAVGTAISVNVYSYDTSTETWTPSEIDPVAYRDATKRTVRPEEGTILSMSVTLSGDGKVLTVAEWDVGSPQVIVQSFRKEKYYSDWDPMGDPMEFLYGPVSIALSESGDRFAVVAEHPGKGSVFEWDKYEWKAVGGNAEHGFLPGGSSVALSGDGNRVLIGDSSLNEVTVYDYRYDYEHFYNAEEWSAWLPTVSLWGDDNSSFGTSVTMDDTGSLLGVGAPKGQDNTGQVTFYA